MYETAKSTEAQEVRATAVSLLELEDEGEFTDSAAAFLNERVARLSEGTTTSLNATKGNFQGYIGPSVEIFPFALGKGYKLDDPEMYTTVMPHMRRFYIDFLHQIENPERAYLNAALFTAQYVQQEYFGNIHNGKGAMERREFLLGDFIVDDDEPSTRSIAEFKGVAMCAERAAVANNVLQIFGMEPILEMGKLQIN